MKLEDQVCSLDLAKRLIAESRSGSTIKAYEALPEMRAYKTSYRFLRAQDVPLGERAVSGVLQDLYAQTPRSLVSRTGRSCPHPRTTKVTSTARPRVLSQQASTSALGLEDRRAQSIRRQMRVLRRGRAEVPSDRSRERRWSSSPQDVHFHNLRLASSAQLSVRFPLALPQLQHGNGILERMSS